MVWRHDNGRSAEAARRRRGGFPAVSMTQPICAVPEEPVNNELEALTRDYGAEIFARLGDSKPLPMSASWWDDRMMEWTMGEEAIKVQLFRFIDALPLLESHREVNRHLREYFTEAEKTLPRWLRLGVRWMPSDGLAGR